MLVFFLLNVLIISRMIIVNEQCILSNLSEQQTKTYNKVEEATTGAVVAQVSTNPAEAKQNMIEKFSELTNLTLNWSKE